MVPRTSSPSVSTMSRSSSELSSDRGSPVTRPGSSATGSSVHNNMGQQCSVDGCNKLCFTGGPLCQLHAGHRQGSTPLLGPSQLRSASLSSSPAGPKHIQTRLGNSYRNPGQPKSHVAHDPLASHTERPSGASGASPHSPSSKKLLDAKFAARKTAGRPKPAQPHSNSAAATEDAIVVASSPDPVVKADENLRDDDSSGPPRKKARTSPAGTETTSFHSTSGPGASDKHPSPTTAPNRHMGQEGSRVETRRRIEEDRNFNLRAQTENPSPTANGTVSRENAHTMPNNFSQPVAMSNANMRTKAPAIREVFNIQARGDAECLSASPRPVQRILPAPVPTLGRPSPPSDLVSNGKSPNPPTASNVNQGIPDQINRRATQSPSIVAPQPQARRQNHVLDRETSFGQGPQKTGAQSQSPLFGSFGSLFNRQDSHSQPPRPPKNSPRASPLPSEINNFSGFGLHPNRNDRNTGLGRSQSPNPELLRRQQEAKPRTQPVGGSAQANNVQGSNTQSNGVSHTAAKVPEPTPSSSTQPTANSRSFNLKLPGDGFLHFGAPSRAHHYSATSPQVQPAAQTAAQRALTYSAAFSPNGDAIKKSSSSSPQLPPAAVASPSNGLRAPVAPMIEGQNGHKTHIEPLEVISIDSSSDDDSSKRRTGFPRPHPPQASSAQQVQKVRQTQQEKQPATNGLAVVNQVPTKVAINGTTASVVSGDKTSDSDRPLMDRRKPITGPKTVANGFGGSASGPERSQVVRRGTGSVPDLDGNVSGNKSSDSDRPIMERWRVGVAQKAVSTRTDAKRLDSDRLVAGPARDPNVVPDPAPARAPSPEAAQVISEPAAANKSGDKTSDSDRPLLAPDRRWTNVTRQRWEQLSPAQRREMLVDTHDVDKFDSAIYSKSNESSRPNSVIFGIPPHALQATASSRPMPQVSAHFNPWTHWTHARTPEWHAQKQVEIRARGNRKNPGNFGQVAKRLAQGKATRGRLPSYQKQELPDRVKTNPAWMSALAELDKLKEAYHADQRTKVQQRKKRAKGKGKARLFDDDGDVEMDSPGSGSDKDPAQQRPTEFVLFRGDWTSTK